MRGSERHAGMVGVMALAVNRGRVVTPWVGVARFGLR
jgi:hypothetical protein